MRVIFVLALTLAFSQAMIYDPNRICACQLFNDPVCASNFKTYDSVCAMGCDSDYPPKSLSVIFKGRCEDLFAPTTPAPSHKKYRLCGCQPINDPVCASNFQTYKNKCEMGCDADYAVDALTVIYKGKCEDILPQTTPTPFPYPPFPFPFPYPPVVDPDYGIGSARPSK